MQRARRRSTGETLLAFKLTGDEWEALRAHRADIELADGCACGSLRRLHTGYKTFVHERDSGCSWTDREDHESESPEHETGKVVIERACGRAGWMAEVESPGPPIEPGSRTRKWWADVLASKGRVRIAFEVQWSTQTLARTWERQERYRGDGVRGCWFFRNPPPGSEAPDETCPMFPLELINVDNEEYAVMIGDRRVSLGQGVEDLLAGKVRLCQEVTTLWWEDARLTFAPARCPRCAEESYVHAATVTWHRPHYSLCGRLVYPSPGPESRTATGIEAIERADLAALVEQFFADKGAGVARLPLQAVGGANRSRADCIPILTDGAGGPAESRGGDRGGGGGAGGGVPWPCASPARPAIRAGAIPARRVLIAPRRYPHASCIAHVAFAAPAGAEVRHGLRLSRLRDPFRCWCGRRRPGGRRARRDSQDNRGTTRDAPMPVSSPAPLVLPRRRSTMLRPSDCCR